MSSTTNDTCRLTVVAPTGWAEVALPSHIPLADLVPVLVRNAGPQLAEDGMQRGGWVLQRLGEAPLDDDRSPAALGLRDGDTVYLRSRQAELPPFDFDDLIDGIATGIERRPDRWQQKMTRRLFLGLQLVALAAGLVILLLGGPTTPRALAANAVAVLLLVGAAAMSRGIGDSVAGALLGGAALPYAAIGNLLAIPGGSALSAPHVMASGAAVTAVALMARVAIGDARPFFVAATAIGAFGTVGGLLGTITSVTSAGAGAILAALALSLTPAAPALAFRLGGLHLPPLPSGRRDLQDNLDPVPGDVLMTRTLAIDNYLTALFTVVGVVCGVSLTLVLRAPGWESKAFAAIVCALLLLRTRVLISGWQRLVATGPAVYGLTLLVLGWARGGSAGSRLEIVFELVVVAGLLLAAARAMPDRRLLPYWGRAAELIESLLAISVLPLALAVLNVYSYFHHLAG